MNYHKPDGPFYYFLYDHLSGTSNRYIKRVCSASFVIQRSADTLLISTLRTREGTFNYYARLYRVTFSTSVKSRAD
jgi:hypothetical protein